MIIGTDGLDHIFASPNDVVCARGGDDIVELRLANLQPDNSDDWEHYTTVDLGYGNDVMSVIPEDNIPYGYVPVDADGGPGNDRMDGGPGNDFLDAGDGGFSIAGYGGYDQCTAYAVGSGGFADDCENFHLDDGSPKAYYPAYRKAATPVTTTTR